VSRLRIVVVCVVLALISFASARVAAQDDEFLVVAHDSAVGAFLTDAAGMTIYLFTPDTTPGESACYDQCAENWPPLTAVERMALPAGVPGELGTIERTDGIMQVTYNDIPLYFYIQDSSPGDIVGQGRGGVWFVVPPGAELGPYAPAPGEGTPVPAATLSIGFTGELGPFLADAEGRTVYLFTEDTTAGESVCYDECAENWPPVPATEGMLLPPGIQGALSAVERTDGSSQLAYNDIPLYYFVSDANPGDTTGHDVGDVWYVVSPGMQHGDAPHEAGEGEMAAATPAS
jgi:predicted lipoprotein with Yx(FWY)xxD motif